MTYPRSFGPTVRNRFFVLSDTVLFSVSTALAFALRFEGFEWPEPYRQTALVYLLVSVPLRLAVCYQAGIYKRLWRHASVVEVERLITAVSGFGLACVVAGALILPALRLVPARVPISVLFLDILLSAVFVTLPRLGVRLLTRRRQRRSQAQSERVIIVGAGAAGELIGKELLGHPQIGLQPVGFVDDDRRKHGHRMLDLPVLGALKDLTRLIDELAAQEVIIAMPRAPGKVVREVVDAAHAAGARARTVPGMFDILSGRVSVTALREVQIEDLLRREPISTDMAQVRQLACGETVLVTGAGGSIGSELCRQLALLEPARIIMLGHGENSIFDTYHELVRLAPSVTFVPVIADIRDRQRMQHVFETFTPYAVFHAAAHKHVPLMETNSAEAVTNNVLGTRNVAELSAEYGAKHFVLISTDKAVRPTNVMGATKRVAEQIVQRIAEEQAKNFVAVRFGNVLGSRGSVVPTFLRQIREGGPLTITHPEMRRYFMTIPEAVQLVLQAGAIGQGGEVFVLDMGEPLKIVDLANDLIRLSGLEVGDIEIRFSGTRPGEKLYEELFFNSENAAPTSHPKVLRAKNGVLPVGIEAAVDRLLAECQNGVGGDELRMLLLRLVPDYTPASAAGPRATPARGLTALLKKRSA
jgi:FlaA1/EpsC-like NDP-sugar epimerase